jgi:hypothetical protein
LRTEQTSVATHGGVLWNAPAEDWAAGDRALSEFDSIHSIFIAIHSRRTRIISAVAVLRSPGWNRSSLQDPTKLDAQLARHQREGDFPECGYFSGVAIDPQSPLVWRVAPGLRFHSATDTLRKYLSPEIQVTRIGPSENWRRGLQIVFRQQLNYFCPEKKEGKRPGLNQYHFPGCVLEVIKLLDVHGGKRLHEAARQGKSSKRQ